MASYNRLNPEDTTVSTDKVVSNTWSDDTNILENHFTSSTQTAISTATSQGNFFWEVYASSSNQSVKPIQGEGPVQYTVSYGHRAGSGSLNFTPTAGALGNTATKCIYRQYAQLVYGDESSNFVFNGYEADDIYVLNIARSRYKHALKVGSLNLRLDNATNIDFFTDDSITQTGSAVTTNLGRQFNLVSGSDGVMSGSKLTQTSHLTAVDSVDSGSFGFVYPEAGVIIFNAAALRKRTNAYWTKGTAAATENIVGLMCGAIQRGNAFELDSEERVSSQYMFVRVKNSDFNYSSNPSYIDTNGNLNNTTMVDSPTTYITTVGLYNDDNNLLAVAKLSQPLKKDFTTEALVRIKLDY
tara:strand:+ start:8719 stop:9783 length:1065 start_codon:yes stop_codon:yes gene_type:complete